MAPTLRPDVKGDPSYPTSDGKPMAETDLHRQIMVDLIQMLQDRYADDPAVYVSGDLLLFYERGNKRRHVAPDVFVVFGVPKKPDRINYILWDEGKGPDVVIEVTSRTTRKEDQTKKLALYRDVLRVPEYFQFDPTRDYLKPPLQGFRLVGDRYEPIAARDGRLPSAILGLDLERDGEQLRLFDPAQGRYLPTRLEAREQAEAARQQAEARALAAEEQERRAQAENDRLRRELEELRTRLGDGS